jgi:ankyrin repeat protein
MNDPSVVDLLIVAGADVNTIDSFGMTPLIKASMGKSKEGVVETLIRAGADVHHVDPTGRTAIDWAGNRRTRKLLSEAGCRPGPKVIQGT